MDDISTGPADATTSTGAVPRGTTLATLGFAMAAAAPILFIIVALLAGFDDFLFFFFPAALALVGGVLVRRRGTVPKVIAIVLAVLVAGALFWTAFGLSLPSSILDFLPGLLLIPGALLAIGATVTAIRAEKRGQATGPGETRAALVIVTALGVLTFVSAGLTVTGRETVSDEAAADADLVVDLQDFEFDDDAYEVSAGGSVLVKNGDPVVHTFTIEDLGIDVDLGPFSEEVVEIPDEPGTYVLICEPHTSDAEDPTEDDMASEITIG